MGMYDTVSAWIKCPFCKRKMKHDNLQTKDFARNLDYLKQGESTNVMRERWFLHDASLFRGEGKYEEMIEKQKTFPKYLQKIKYTRESCRPMKITEVRKKYKNKKKFHLNVHFFKVRKNEKRRISWSCYKYTGKSPTVFQGTKEMDFNCYGSCKHCGRWLECVGKIRNSKFIGAEVNIQSSKEQQPLRIRRKPKKK